MATASHNGVVDTANTMHTNGSTSNGGSLHATGGAEGEPQTPGDMWETAFVWAFVVRFTDLKGKVEGLDNVYDFESALGSSESNPILNALLAQFIENLQLKRSPRTHSISQVLYTLVSELCNTGERTIWWDPTLGLNKHVLSPDTNFFGLPWKVKIEVLRQLVEWQLSRNPTVRETLDNAYGVQRGGHRKKTEEEKTSALETKGRAKADKLKGKDQAKSNKGRMRSQTPEKNDGEIAALPRQRLGDDTSKKDSLRMVPVGLDKNRKRYWAVDDSPRLYISGNPWKNNCPFNAISSTREEYLAVVQRLKDEKPRLKPNGRRSAFERHHDELVAHLEGDRMMRIDSEIFRLSMVQKRRRERQKEMEQLKALAELRTTRTRVKTAKVNYVYAVDSDPEDGGRKGGRSAGEDDGDYSDEQQVVHEEEDYEDDEGDDEGSGRRSRGRVGSLRRSGRISTSGPRAPLENGTSGRRSTRLATTDRTSRQLSTNADDGSDYRPQKRRRMSSDGSLAQGDLDWTSGNALLAPGAADSTLPKNPGAAGLKPHETVVEAVAGKRKSKFWYYAVEEVSAQPTVTGSMSSVASGTPSTTTTPLPDGPQMDIVESKPSHSGDSYMNGSSDRNGSQLDT